MDPENQDLQNVLGDLADLALEPQILPSDLFHLGSLELQADHHHRWLGVPVVPEVHLNLKVLCLP